MTVALASDLLVQGGWYAMTDYYKSSWSIMLSVNALNLQLHEYVVEYFEITMTL
jgi:hypothetical protein